MNAHRSLWITMMVIGAAVLSVIVGLLALALGFSELAAVIAGAGTFFPAFGAAFKIYDKYHPGSGGPGNGQGGGAAS